MYGFELAKIDLHQWGKKGFKQKRLEWEFVRDVIDSF